jgi:hypothetical protein
MNTLTTRRPKLLRRLASVTLVLTILALFTSEASARGGRFVGRGGYGGGFYGRGYGGYARPGFGYGYGGYARPGFYGGYGGYARPGFYGGYGGLYGYPYARPYLAAPIYGGVGMGYGAYGYPY